MILFGANKMTHRLSVVKFTSEHYAVLKRAIDIAASASVIVLLAPIMILTAIAVKITSEGPILFWSKRRGLHGELFSMPKFRTMTVGSKVVSRELASYEDITYTPIGKFLRKTSLDELPQLWVVLTGKMSLIGPRPLIENDQAEESRLNNKVIYSVKPGITGLAQVNGRNFITVQNKTRYDAFYASRACLILDVKIVLKTLGVLFKADMVK